MYTVYKIYIYIYVTLYNLYIQHYITIYSDTGMDFNCNGIVAIVILAGFSRRSDLRMNIHWGYHKESSFLMLVGGLEHEWIMTFHLYIYIILGMS
jgi:hypothetical protein